MKTTQARSEAADPLIGVDAWTTSISVEGKRAIFPCTVTAVGDWKFDREGKPWRSMSVFVPGFNAGGNIVVNADTVFSDPECKSRVDVGAPPAPRRWSGVVAASTVELVNSPPTPEEVLAAMTSLGHDGTAAEAASIAAQIDFAQRPVCVDRELGVRVNVEDQLTGARRKYPVIGVNGRSFAHVCDPAVTRQDGFYELRARGILFHDDNKEPFAFAVANPSQGYFFVSCSAHPEGIRYMYGTSEADSKRLGIDGLSSSKEKEVIHSILEHARLHETRIAAEGIDLIDGQEVGSVSPEQLQPQEAVGIACRKHESEPEGLHYAIGQRFTFEPGQPVIANGYPGAVKRMYTEGMVEVRLDAGLVCVPASYPDCYPSDRPDPANPPRMPSTESTPAGPDL
ncbi:Uncharacterised protein [Burkholderia pseudomallei]|nr:Uncharacterised protein [Burkholderia pseudomallei]CAJ6707389.1 Uncharacterised protein [Burkholderia pseudomallei]